MVNQFVILLLFIFITPALLPFWFGLFFGLILNLLSGKLWPLIFIAVIYELTFLNMTNIINPIPVSIIILFFVGIYAFLKRSFLNIDSRQI